jgi:hypothetical protein
LLKVYFLGCFAAFEAEAEADTTYAGACAESDAETASEPCAASAGVDLALFEGVAVGVAVGLKIIETASPSGRRYNVGCERSEAEAETGAATTGATGAVADTTVADG